MELSLLIRHTDSLSWIIWLGPVYSQGSLEVEEGGTRVCQSNVTGEGFSLLWLALKRDGSYGMEKAKNLSPGASRKELSLADTLILAQ